MASSKIQINKNKKIKNLGTLSQQIDLFCTNYPDEKPDRFETGRF
jgi:hypothetical protein